jgi:hypothetical protein
MASAVRIGKGVDLSIAGPKTERGRTALGPYGIIAILATDHKMLIVSGTKEAPGLDF